MQANNSISKKKRLLALAGILAVPMIIIVVMIVSITQPRAKTPPKNPDVSAFNPTLPSANLPKKEQSKLELYMKAQDDSIRQHADRAKDPYSSLSLIDTSHRSKSGLPVYGSGSLSPYRSVPASSPENTDRQINDRMTRLYGLINNSPSAPGSHKNNSFPTSPDAASPDLSPQLERLQKMMLDNQKPDTTPSVQLTQVRQILDQIKEIQHPTSLTMTPSSAEPPLRVSAQPLHSDSVSSPAAVSLQNGFFGLSDDPDTLASSTGTAIEAVVNADQVVQTGSIVKLRLTQPIYISGVAIPANSFIYGPATISGERVSIQLTNVLYAGRVYPIALSVYDGADGLQGLYVPGMITRDVVKQNMSQSVSGLSLGTLDPSLGAQAASAAIETARNLMSRKIAIVKATLKAGHRAVLRSNR